jgi:hypothetical protein
MSKNVDSKWLANGEKAVRALEEIYGKHQSVFSPDGNINQVHVEWPYGRVYLSFSLGLCEPGEERAASYAGALRAALAEPQPEKQCQTCVTRELEDPDGRCKWWPRGMSEAMFNNGPPWDCRDHRKK